MDKKKSIVILLTFLAIFAFSFCNKANAAVVLTIKNTPIVRAEPYYSSNKIIVKEVKYISGYKYYKKIGNTYKLIKTTTSREFCDNGLPFRKTYYYKVRTYKKVGTKIYYSPYSKTIVSTTNIAMPNMNVTNFGEKNQITTKWVRGATEYRIYCSTDNVNWKIIASLDTKTYFNNTYFDTGLTLGKTYYYKMRSVRIADGKTWYSLYTPAKKGQCLETSTGEYWLNKFAQTGVSKDSPQYKLVQNACSLVGNVTYFWGGKYPKIGFNEAWGSLWYVWIPGGDNFGRVMRYGLDCSGFIEWTFINASGYVKSGDYIGRSARYQYANSTKISWKDLKVGDLVFYPKLDHVGMVIGFNAKNEPMICHENSTDDNVTITGKRGFTLAGRPSLKMFTPTLMPTPTPLPTATPEITP